MSSTDINNHPSVRLASGVEVHQRWPSFLPPAEPKSTEQPKLFQMSPLTGNEGTIVTVVVQSMPTIPIRLAFNTFVVETKQMQAQGMTSLVATVPPFQLTHSSTPHVPVYICTLDNGAFTNTWLIADFVYDFSIESSDPAIEYSPEQKRLDIDSDLFQPKDNLYTNDALYPMFPTNNNEIYNNLPQYGYADKREVYADKFTSYPDNPENLNLDPTFFESNSSSMNTLFDDLNDTSLSSADLVTPATSSPPKQPLPEPSYKPTGYGKSSIHLPSTSVANYQPYPGLVSRANLRIMSDLDAMAKNWTNEEWDHRRRLVQFWREQKGNEIQCSFAPISQSDMSAHGAQIVVSCIYWPERNDCFITSVDCIHLLESLLNIRFSVEEKNRVRRNLEGFRPLTVSKCKSDSADFFKLIMSFPNPKPRNIEKDVKVFPWKTLPYALKKIVTKYTASSYHTNNANNHYHRRSQVKNCAISSNNSPPTQSLHLEKSFYQPQIAPQPYPMYDAYSSGESSVRNMAPTYYNDVLPTGSPELITSPYYLPTYKVENR